MVMQHFVGKKHMVARPQMVWLELSSNGSMMAPSTKLKWLDAGNSLLFAELVQGLLVTKLSRGEILRPPLKAFSGYF